MAGVSFRATPIPYLSIHRCRRVPRPSPCSTSLTAPLQGAGAPPMPSARPPARGGFPGARPAWYAERPRGHRASRGPDAARCPAPQSPHRSAAPGPGECLVAAGTLPHDCRAGRPGTPRAAGPGQAAPGRAHAVLVGVPLPGSLAAAGRCRCARCWRVGGLGKAAWRCCSSRHCARAVSI